MRRIGVLLTVALMMAVMMMVSTAPAFAYPTDPLHGQRVSEAAKFFPVDPLHPVRGPYQGQKVSQVAKSNQPVCDPFNDVCPNP